MPVAPGRECCDRVTMPVQIEQPVTLDVWQSMLRELDGNTTTFHDYATAFHGNDITDE